MNKKAFLITVDTEGDNLWAWKEGTPISTENSGYIPRFQNLCEDYGFKPVYLINYEMAQNKTFMSYIKEKQQNSKCEVGLHIHAWNTPPEYPLEKLYGGNPYITEYPYEIMLKKIISTKEILEDAIGEKVISHRSGRWALNSEYLKALAECGIEIDCSVTPQLDLSGIAGYSCNCGNNYKDAPKTPYYIHPQILEVPMTTRCIRHISNGTIKHRIKTLIKKEEMWLRPFSKSVASLVYLTQKIEKEQNSDYLEFMIHSSELMPGGSPYFKNESDIELLYSILDNYFAYVSQKGYCGKTLSEYSKGRIFK